VLANDTRCPCGTGLTYGECCGRFHAGQPAPTAEALMRSRFTAFVTGDANYLRSTWHPSRRPERLDLDADLVWQRLEVLGTTGTPFDSTATVEFIAHFKDADERGTLHENSEFVREQGRWFYVRALQ
jgi:SEC-C motif-containing protein